ncbi:hypothetical protein, partial [Roseovarius sp.]|uniref:hypothetical protein n=1 Tax=Roseovarius sp. TaxID=1486281 RepID=UPI0035697B42
INPQNPRKLSFLRFQAGSFRKLPHRLPHATGVPKFINKIDKYLSSFMPIGQKCYNTSAVRLALEG